jgi:hypothetical protein
LGASYRAACREAQDEAEKERKATEATAFVLSPKVLKKSKVMKSKAKATNTGLGKNSMIAKGKSRFPRLLAAIEDELPPGRSMFLCLHKDIEHIAINHVHPFARFDAAHWGGIDGRND